MTILTIGKSGDLSKELIRIITEDYSSAEETNFITIYPKDEECFTGKWRDWFNDIHIDLTDVSAIIIPCSTNCRSGLHNEIGVLLERLKNLNDKQIPIVIFHFEFYEPMARKDDYYMGNKVWYYNHNSFKSNGPEQVASIRKVLNLPLVTEENQEAMRASFCR